MSFGFGGGSGGQIRYTISVDDSQAVYKLQSVGQQFQTLGQATETTTQQLDQMPQSLDNVKKSADALDQSHQSLGQSIKNNGLAIATAVTSVISLVQQYTSLKRAQNQLEKAQNVEKGQVIAIAKARDVYNKAVKKYGENSKEAKTALDKLNLAESKHQTQVERIDLMQESLNSRLADFAVNIVPSAIGIVSGLTQTFDILGKGRTGRGGIGGVLTSLGKFALPIAAIGFAAFAVKSNLFGFRDALDGVGAAIGKAIPGIKPFLDAIRNVGVVLGLVPGDAKKAQAELKNFAGGIIAWGQDIIKQVGAVFDKLKSGDVVGAIADVKKMAVNAFKSIGVDIRKEVAKFKKDPIQYVTDVVVDLLNKIGDITINGITLRQWKAALPILIKTEIADAKGNVLVGLGNVVVDIANATIGPDATKKIQDALANLRTTILTSTHKSAVTLASPMKRGVMYDFLDAIIPGVGTQVQNWVSTAMGNFKVAWKQFVISIKNFIVGMPATGIDFVASVLKTTTGLEKQFISWFATNLAPPIGKAWATLVKTVQGFFESNPIFKDIGSRISQILGTASLAVNDFNAWFDKFLLTPLEGAWNDTVTAVVKYVIDPVNTLFNGVTASGILGAIPNFVSELSKWFDTNITQPIKNEINTVIADLEKLLGINLNANPTIGVSLTENQGWPKGAVGQNELGQWVDKNGKVLGTSGNRINQPSGNYPGGAYGGSNQTMSPFPTKTSAGTGLSGITDPTVAAQQLQKSLANLANQGANSMRILGNAAKTNFNTLANYAKGATVFLQGLQKGLANLANQGANSTRILGKAAATNFNTVANYAKGATPDLQKLQKALANLANQGSNSMRILGKAAKTNFNTVANYAAGATPDLQKLQKALANLANQGSNSMRKLASAAKTNFNTVANYANGATKAVNKLQSSISSLKSKDITVTTHFKTTGQVTRLQHGGTFMTHGPEMIMVGDNPSGRERVSVTPEGGSGGGHGSGTLVVNLTNVNSDRETLRTFRRELGKDFYRFGPS